MKYYKIIDGENFIGIATSENFKKYNPISGFLLSSNENEGEFIRIENKLYRDLWMAVLPQKQFEYFQVQVIEINEEEYNTLYELEHSNDVEPNYKSFIPVADEMIVDEIVDPISELTLDYIKDKKIQALSDICRKTIEAGFDLKLRGEVKHFSLDTQDQLNLMNLGMLTQTQDLIPYHADNELCIFYTPAEIQDIISAANNHKTYHTTYYNALKAYVRAQDTIDKISEITYGSPIPEEYKSDVLKTLE